jgi:hypothetical protein
MSKDPEMHIYPDPDYTSNLQTTKPKKTDPKASGTGAAASPASPASSNQ